MGGGADNGTCAAGPGTFACELESVAGWCRRSDRPHHPAADVGIHSTRIISRVPGVRSGDHEQK